MSEIFPEDRDTREKLNITEKQRQNMIRTLNKYDAALEGQIEEFRNILF